MMPDGDIANALVSAAVANNQQGNQLYSPEDVRPGRGVHAHTVKSTICLMDDRVLTYNRLWYYGITL